ncbi:MAG: sulfotransferase [Rhodospirillaceae bacterium]|nr:MAG: sulfotransferase [Rhodospirillaceae bacterium]
MMEERFDPPAKFAAASDQLHDLVARQVGSSDFGDSDYLMGLRVLLQSMDYDPIYTERGRRLAWGTVISALSSRVHAVRAMAQVPDLDRQMISKPVVITGIPRTGTTALHKLMAVDPQFQGLQTWLIGAPMPRPPRETWESNPLFQQEVESLKLRFETTPDMRAAHNMAAEEVDECLGILCHSFVSNLWACNWSSASYDAWWQTQSELPAYRYLRRILQMIGSNEPEKRWLLKNPGHIANLDLLFAMFPDALVIQTHRDPAKAVPSLCALMMQFFGVMEGSSRHQLHAHIMGHRETGKWAKAVRDAEPVRQAHRGQILDVVHGDFHADPIGVIKRIYAFLALNLTPQVEAAMTQRIAAAPELSHGTHRYHVSDFGLTDEEIRESFGSYVDRFDLRPVKSVRAKGKS